MEYIIKMDYVFKIKFRDGFFFKTLTELIKNNINIASFDLDKEKLKMIVTDENKTILIDLEIKGDECEEYYLKPDFFQLNVNVKNLYSMIRTIKKRDSLSFSINSSEPTSLTICIEPINHEMRVVSTINIIMMQNLQIETPEDFASHISIDSTSFHKMIKNMSDLSPSIIISSRPNYINFTSENNRILKRVVEFGDTGSNSIEYSDEFPISQFTKIMKIAGINKNIHFYMEKDSPFIILKSHIEKLGFIRLLIKSKRQIESDT
jgi:DNA polymerase III sliding clamp (beta) subunit (PCNA family)